MRVVTAQAIQPSMVSDQYPQQTHFSPRLSASIFFYFTLFFVITFFVVAIIMAQAVILYSIIRTIFVV